MDMDSVTEYYIRRGGGGSGHDQDNLFGPGYVGSPYA
jgi:hypothetical protein